MATYSGILAWRIPWTEKPGGLQSMDSKELDMTEQSILYTTFILEILSLQYYSDRLLQLIPLWGRSPGVGHDNPYQYSCLENPKDREPGGLQSMGQEAGRG